MGLDPKRRVVFKKYWKCCFCFKCKKIIREESMQLADFNYAMLRAIYCFYLLIFASIVLLVGLLLIPLGYCSIIIVKIRIIMRELRIGRKREQVHYWRSKS